jgi:hypothetical protein
MLPGRLLQAGIGLVVERHGGGLSGHRWISFSVR